MRSLNSILELNVAELDGLIATAKEIIAHPEAYWDKCAHKKLATLFFEPSTRTRLSFEAAMLELGHWRGPMNHLFDLKSAYMKEAE